MPTLIHLIYIHGFNGNDTTFQSFPKHLQQHLETRISQNQDVKIQSSLYPTYKSVKPISYATKNFLEWLSTQPAGPVILLGHSMGGLLAAEAATDSSNNPDKHPGGKPKRIAGVIAFDTPYLGMHPHVIISGIASLMPKGEGSENSKNPKGMTEKAMNQHPQVKIIDQGVTDDWENFKKQAQIHTHNAPYAASTNSHSRATSRESFVSTTSSNFGVSPLSPPSPIHTPSPGHSPSPSATFSPSPSSTFSSRLSPSYPSTFVDRALTYVAAKNDDPLVRWLRKHSDAPFSAGKRWVTEHFQFGACMFDPSGLKNRYSRLVEWEAGGGMWVNYWTTTVPRIVHAGRSVHGQELHQDPKHSPSDVERLDNDDALLTNGILSPSDRQVDSSHDDKTGESASSISIPHFEKEDTPDNQHPSTSGEDVVPVHTVRTKFEAKALVKEANKQLKASQKLVKQEEKQIQREENQIKATEKAQAKALQKQEKQREKQSKKAQTQHHFVVLPNGLGQVLGGMEMWENVPIAGVEDEVNAHTGLFIPKQNLDYEGLVERVADRVLAWCERLSKENKR